MFARSAIAALVYHSNLYSERKKPIVCSFAGEHEEGMVAGSQKVADHLKNFGIPSEDIVTRTNTVTTTTDLMQLHAFMLVRDLKTAAIVTTDDHVLRTKAEIGNHFRRGRRHGERPKIYVLSPSSGITRSLIDCFDGFKNYVPAGLISPISVGKDKELRGGFKEKFATAIALIPVRAIRMPIQRFAEQKSHPHTPVDLERIMKAAKRLGKVA